MHLHPGVQTEEREIAMRRIDGMEFVAAAVLERFVEHKSLSIHLRHVHARCMLPQAD